MIIAPVVAGSDDHARGGTDGAADDRAIVAADLPADDRAQSAADDDAEHRAAGLGGTGGKEAQSEQENDAGTGFHDALLVM
jgi:hypothetical protein